MATKLCHSLPENIDHIIGGVDPSSRYSGHYFYVWFVFHSQALHPYSRELPFPDAPFICRLAILLSPSELKSFKGFTTPCSIIWSSDSFRIRNHSWFANFDDVFNFCAPGHSLMREAQVKWLLCVRPSMLVFRSWRCQM